jgi:hypothetical protein
MKQIASRSGPSPQCPGSREEFWREKLERFADSGQSVCGFCASQGLSQPSFYSWRRRLADGNAAAASMARRRSAPAFVPVHVAAESSAGMEIVLRGDRRIRVCGPVDPAALVDVVSALESLPFREPAQ